MLEFLAVVILVGRLARALEDQSFIQYNIRVVPPILYYITIKLLQSCFSGSLASMRPCYFFVGIQPLSSSWKLKILTINVPK